MRGTRSVGFNVVLRLYNGREESGLRQRRSTQNQLIADSHFNKLPMSVSNAQVYSQDFQNILTADNL